MIRKVIDIIDETPDTRTIRLESDSKFSFKPGQFVMVSMLLKVDNEEKTVKRAYSISSSPLKKEYIDLTVKIRENGLMSPRLFNIKKGQSLDITGPFGNFVFDEEIHKEIVLIGAGCGVTPLNCILRYIKDKKLNTKVILIYSSKTPEDIIFKKELTENKEDSIKNYITITRPEGFKWSGLIGRINEKMLKDIIKDLKKPVYFISGPIVMVNEIKQLLKKMSIEEEKIKSEGF